MCKPADAGWIQEQWCHPGWSAMHPCWQAMLQSIKMVCKFQGALLSTLHHACEHLASQECCAYATSLCQVWSWMLRRLEWGERCCRFGIMKGSEPQKLQIQDSKPHQPPDKMDPVPFACFLCLDGEGSWSSHTHQSQKHSPKCSHGSRKHPLVALDAWIWMASWDPKPKNKKKDFLVIWLWLVGGLHMLGGKDSGSKTPNQQRKYTWDEKEDLEGPWFWSLGTHTSSSERKTTFVAKQGLQELKVVASCRHVGG